MMSELDKITESGKWTIEGTSHGFDCHRCEWAIIEAVSVLEKTNGVSFTYRIGARTAHQATVSRNAA